MKDYLRKILLVGVVSIAFTIVGFLLARRHYEPLLKQAEENYAEFNKLYEKLGELEATFNLLLAKIQLEEARDENQRRWNRGLIYPKSVLMDKVSEED